jgi:hypothetical protein
MVNAEKNRLEGKEDNRQEISLGSSVPSLTLAELLKVAYGAF